MEVELAQETLILRFPSPAAFEVDDEAFLIPPGSDVREIILDLSDVKVMSSLVISRIMTMMDRYRDRHFRFTHMGPELRAFLRRAGFTAWIQLQ